MSLVDLTCTIRLLFYINRQAILHSFQDIAHITETNEHHFEFSHSAICHRLSVPDTTLYLIVMVQLFHIVLKLLCIRLKKNGRQSDILNVVVLKKCHDTDKMAASYRQSAILKFVLTNLFVCHSYLPYQTLFYCDVLAILHSFKYNYHKKPNNGRKAVILDCFALKVVMSFPYLLPHILFYTDASCRYWA